MSETSRSIAAVLARNAQTAPDRPFVQCGDGWITVGEMQARATTLADQLASLGLRPGDRVAALIPNRQEAVDLFFACAASGVVLVPLNCFLKGQFLSYQVADCGAEALIGDADGIAAALAAAHGTDLRLLVTLDPSVPPDTPTPVVGLADVAPGPPGAAPKELSSADLFAIMYTSGTTGMPKGCMIPNGYYFGNATATRAAGWVQPGDRLFTAFPLFHMSGQHCLMSALVNDGSVCFEPTFSAATFIARAREAAATVLMGVGPMAMALLAQPAGPRDDEGGFRMAMMTPLPPEAQAAFEKRFHTPIIAEGYGQTECSPATISSLRGERRRGTVGRPVDHVEAMIVDDGDNEVARGTIGEIVLRPTAPDVMFGGYWNAPEATVSAFRNLWHHTGDLGSMDEDGFVTFVDRKSDSLRRRGENISSFELEVALLRHPAISQVAVSAVASPLGEDDIKASVVFVGDPPSPGDLFEFCKGTVPYFAIPRYVDVRDSLPTNTLGRVQKHILRAEGIPEGTWDLESLGFMVPGAERRGV